MLSEAEFDVYCQHLGLASNTRALLRRIRSSAPSIRLHPSGKGVTSSFPSAKMGWTIQAKHHTVQLPFAYQLEHDSRVLEYYDLPEAIPLTYRTPTGKGATVSATADFFVLWADSAGWLECRSEQDLLQLSTKMPERYVPEADGRWQCPPGRKYAEKLGLSYCLRSSSELNWTLVSNLQYLDDYYRQSRPDLSARDCDEITQIVNAEPGITLKALRAAAESTDGDTVNWMIVTKRLYVDLERDRLDDADHAQVFASKAEAEIARIVRCGLADTLQSRPPRVSIRIGARILWDGQTWEIVNLSSSNVWLHGQTDRPIALDIASFERLTADGHVSSLGPPFEEAVESELKSLLSRASTRDWTRALETYERIKPALARRHLLPPEECSTIAAPYKAEPRSMPERTERFLVCKYREAQRTYGTGLVGLLRADARKGNRTARLPERAEALMDEVIRHEYETPTQKSRRVAHAVLVARCREEGLPPVSYKTFCERIKRRPVYQQAKARQGTRGAYQMEPQFWELTRTVPRHGQFPLQIAHIDHSPLDIELVHSVTGANMGRPWCTVLIDAFSRRVLAAYITYDPPSYRSCLMVLRLCVQRWGRLPQTLVVDGGSEFHSTYFDTFLALYGCMKKTRPAAKPRFGSIVERFFGTSESEFIHNLQGNTKMTRNVRQVTKWVDPKRLAQFDLATFTEALLAWVEEMYDLTPHPALGQSPRQAFEAGLANHGPREHLLIMYDDNFRMNTLPTTAKGTAKVQYRGVKINNIYYWCDKFRNPEVRSVSLEVRFDPFDMGVAYAKVGGIWEKCFSQYYSSLEGHSQRELMTAAQEHAQLARVNARSYPDSASKLVEILRSAKPGTAVDRQRQQDEESRRAEVALGVRSVAAARADGQSANQPPADIPSPEIARQEDVDRGYSGALDTFEIYGDLL